MQNNNTFFFNQRNLIHLQIGKLLKIFDCSFIFLYLPEVSVSSYTFRSQLRVPCQQNTTLCPVIYYVSKFYLLTRCIITCTTVGFDRGGLPSVPSEYITHLYRRALSVVSAIYHSYSCRFRSRFITWNSHIFQIRSDSDRSNEFRFRLPFYIFFIPSLVIILVCIYYT